MSIARQHWPQMYRVAAGIGRHAVGMLGHATNNLQAPAKSLAVCDAQRDAQVQVWLAL